MSATLVSIGLRETSWHSLAHGIVIGKDILELLSSSMYIDPMTIYREYVQNAADAIDDAKRFGLLDDSGRIDIGFDQNERTITIRDNGVGVDEDEFTTRMTAFGASAKRGTTARGFRGVGRLAGLGYCQELVFRSRTARDAHVSELRWDCRKLKQILRSGERKDDLASAVANVVDARNVSAREYPQRFFEVELRGIIRHRNDQLLNGAAVSEYLGQVAPVPFHPLFPFRDQVVAHLREHVRLGDIAINVKGNEEPVYRPHRTGVEYAPARFDPFTAIDLLTIPGMDGGTAAVGWIAHHGYRGALSARSNVRGLRFRSGNIQVGDERLVEDLFPEVRFNGWSVGEIHIIDQRIVPNGRRDHFEQSVHFHNVLTHLVPTARDIARRCRTSSIERKWVRDFELGEEAIRERASILKQGALRRDDRKRVSEEIRSKLAALEQIVSRGLVEIDQATELKARLDKLKRDMARVLKGDHTAKPLEELPGPQRRAYAHVIGLIYECSANQTTAKLLVDKILARIK
ncbi:MAG: ATP-binding protein [Acidobacteriaceae bacterium]|nr:ATP-binding protein [Acidobacteriaceae bacterium]